MVVTGNADKLFCTLTSNKAHAAEQSFHGPVLVAFARSATNNGVQEAAESTQDEGAEGTREDKASQLRQLRVFQRADAALPTLAEHLVNCPRHYRRETGQQAIAPH
jgi:hypothetical protein